MRLATGVRKRGSELAVGQAVEGTSGEDREVRLCQAFSVRPQAGHFTWLHFFSQL